MYFMTLSIGHGVPGNTVIGKAAMVTSRFVYRMYSMTLSIDHGVQGTEKAAMAIKIGVQNVLYDT